MRTQDLIAILALAGLGFYLYTQRDSLRAKLCPACPACAPSSPTIKDYFPNPAPPLMPALPANQRWRCAEVGGSRTGYCAPYTVNA